MPQNIHDDALMASWAKDRLVIVIRVDPRSDEYLRIDSELMRQLKEET
jgi:hypothetical protein